MEAILVTNIAVFQCNMSKVYTYLILQKVVLVINKIFSEE